MNTAAMLMCLAGALSPGQAEDVVFREARIQVKRFPGFGDREFPHHALHFNRINIGTNFLKPTKNDDFGNPDRDKSRLATTYFHREGPVGVVMEKFNWCPLRPNTYHADARLPASMVFLAAFDPFGHGQLVNLWSEPPIAVVEIDTGTMASYARPTQMLHYFEPTPAIVKMSLPEKGKQPLFHFIPDALARGAAVGVFEGEPRATIEKHAGAGFYHAIIINTYKLPVVTVHKGLMTKEGMEMLMGKTCPEGILCYHTSNRYYNLVPVVASSAAELKYACLVGRDMNSDYQHGHFTSEWVMVARKAEHLAHLKAPPGYDQALKAKMQAAEPYWSTPTKSDRKFIWTDRGDNAFRGLYRADPAIGEFGNALGEFERFVFDRVGFLQGLERHTDPVHRLLDAWSRSNAEFYNREPGEVPKKSKKPKEKTYDRDDAPKK